MAEVNVWEKSYQSVKQLWSSKPDAKLMQYFDLIKKGNILDCGIGEGRNAVPFALSGFNIDGIEISETALKRCRENLMTIYNSSENNDLNKNEYNINLIINDLRTYNIKKDNYTAIVVANVLNFFKKSEIDLIIKNIKEGLKEDGMVYISVFSTLEPRYTFLKENNKQVEENTFYREERDSYVHYFTQKEICDYFSDFELICCIEGLEYDSGHGEPHYHGGIEFIARKKK